MDTDETTETQDPEVETTTEPKVLPSSGSTTPPANPAELAAELEKTRAALKAANAESAARRKKLEAFETFGQELDLFYLPRGGAPEEAQEEEVELTDRDVVVGYYEGDRLDLGEVVREQILLALPLKPLCREDCRGLCPACGQNRNLVPCGCPPPEEPGDPRLEPLRKLVDKNRQ